MTPESPSRVQRLWRLARIDRQVIGVVYEGHVPGVTPPDTTDFVAVVDMVLMGERVQRVEPDGRRVWVMPIADDAPRARRGQRFDDLADAFTWLDVARRALLEEGWLDVGLDPLKDPD